MPLRPKRPKRVRTAPKDVTAKSALIMERIPVIFGTKARTKAIVALCINGPGRVSDMHGVAAASNTSLYGTLEKLAKLGIVGWSTKTNVRIYWMNRKHQCYPEFMEIAKLVDERWPVPRWEPRPRPLGRFSARDKAPKNPPCTLFYFEAMTRCLMFIAAAGRASALELADLLGYYGSIDLKPGLNRLVKDGLIKSGPREFKTASLDFHLNEDHFAYGPLKRILAKLNKLHPDVSTLAQHSAVYRKDRRYRENRDSPHILGPWGSGRHKR